MLWSFLEKIAKELFESLVHGAGHDENTIAMDRVEVIPGKIIPLSAKTI